MDNYYTFGRHSFSQSLVRNDDLLGVAIVRNLKTGRLIAAAGSQG